MFTFRSLNIASHESIIAFKICVLNGSFVSQQHFLIKCKMQSAREYFNSIIKKSGAGLYWTETVDDVTEERLLFCRVPEPEVCMILLSWPITGETLVSLWVIVINSSSVCCVTWGECARTAGRCSSESVGALMTSVNVTVINNDHMWSSIMSRISEQL